MPETDTFNRPFSTSSVISSHLALEALAEQAELDDYDSQDFPPRSSGQSSSHSRSIHSESPARDVRQITSSQSSKVNGFGFGAQSSGDLKGLNGRRSKSGMRPQSRAGIDSSTTTARKGSLSRASISSESVKEGDKEPRRSIASLSASASGSGSSSLTPVEDEFEGRHFVRAIFEYKATDPSALSFEAGDIIEVITQLQSGWWDGLLGKQRGWFPSNFVEGVDPNDILDEIAFEDEEYDQVLEQGQGQDRDQDQDRGQRGDEHPTPQSGTSSRASGVGYRDSLTTDERDEDNLRTPHASGQQQDPTNGRPKSGDSQDIGLDDVLGRGAAYNGDWEGMGLDDLAREVMAQGSQGQADDDFLLAARDRRKKMDEKTSKIEDYGLGAGADDGGFLSAAEEQRRKATAGGVGQSAMNDLGVGSSSSRRRREETDQTVTQLQRSHEGGTGEADAWVPSVTPDGQIYYHNELTGEDAWDLPVKLTEDDPDIYSGEDENFFDTFAASGPSSAAYAAAAQNGTSSRDQRSSVNDFRLPLKSDDLPHPWIAKMRDDGRGWYYLNRITGQTRDRPPSPGTKEKVLDTSSRDRHSPSSIPPPRKHHHRPRPSTDLRHKQINDWSQKTKSAMKSAMEPPNPPTMGYMMDIVNDSLRDVFEACVAGSAAEEELSRSEDLGSEAGVSLALAREDAAGEMLRIAHLSVLASIRALFSAFGYIGPLDKPANKNVEEGMEMTRPDWVGDMTLIGSIGLLSANVHAATTSHRQPDSGLSIWAEVMKSASKLKDIIAGFPAAVSPNLPAAEREGVQGKLSEGYMTAEQVGETMGGKWGFGPVSADSTLMRSLDQRLITDLQSTKDAADTAISSISGPLPEDLSKVLRPVSQFTDMVSSIDIAHALDFDGDLDGSVKDTEAASYRELVTQARHTIMILHTSYNAITSNIADLVMYTDENSKKPLQALRSSLSSTFDTISTLQRINLAQVAMIEKGLVRGQIGHRSYAYTSTHRPRSSARPASITSSTSRFSKLSSARRQQMASKGLEDEFLDSGDFDDESRDTAGELWSASTSASQTSIPQVKSSISNQPRSRPTSGGGVRTGNAGEVSATSSTTSLTYQKTESDSGSTKGKRSSIMKFMRGRGSTDAEDARNRRPGGPSKKLAKILGEDISSLSQLNNLPPPQAPPIQQAPETPWYLGEDYDSSEILFDDKGGVRAGTLKALVARLTPHGSTDTQFFQAFMLTFRSFVSGEELLEKLLERYYIQPPDGLTQGEMADWTKQKQTPLRLRVCNVLRAWLDKAYVDEHDRSLLDRIERFADGESKQLAAQQIKTLAQRRRRGEIETQKRIISGGLLSPPAPLLPRMPQGRDLRVTDIAPIELARQLTILEFDYFQRIKPVECLNKAWNRSDGDKVAPNVRSVIKTANILSGWVGTTCLSSRDAKSRASIMKYFIQTAIELRNLNNFSSMAAVAAGLNTAPVLRLKRSWELCSAKTTAMKAEVDKALDSTKNFSNYKDMLKTINPPCVPFFGFWLSALTFIEDGNKDFVSANSGKAGMSTSNSSSSLSITSKVQSNQSKSGNPASNTSTPASTSASASGTGGGGEPKQLINFFKRSLSAEILRDIQQYQSQPYNLARSKLVFDWLMRQLEFCDKTYDLEKLYNLSLQLEPREKEEERITRMLHDSGFI